jgi:hypothetical protein
VSDPNDEQERCESCKGRKFDPPRKKCIDLDFHWLLAGREWEWSDDDGVYKAVLTTEAVKSSYDGLIKVEEAPEAVIMPRHTTEIFGVTADGDTITWKSDSVIELKA